MVGIVLRVLVVLGLLGSAAVHLLEWNAWARDTAVIGPLFLVNVVAGIVIAAAIIVWPHWLPPLAAVGFGLATLGAYVLSLTVGLFDVKNQFTSTAEIGGVITEVGCVLFGAAILLRQDWRGRRAVSDRAA